MQIQQPSFNLDKFFSHVRSARARALLLDYDGTLAPFQVDPAEAKPYPGVIERLDAIMDSDHTRLVIVSGRWTKSLIPLLGLKKLPEIWGSHGWERLHAHGEYETARIRPKALEFLVASDEWITEIESLGARAERKPASIAFHWRGLNIEQVANIRSRLLEKWVELAATRELAWRDFNGGIELRAAGRDKGHVVRTIAEEAGANAAIAYLGDDLTDEDAFKAVPVDGAAVLVQTHLRSTAADLWIQPPEELFEFLDRWHREALGR